MTRGWIFSLYWYGRDGKEVWVIAALQGVVLTPLCSEAETSQNWCTHHRCVVHWGYNVSFNIVWSNEVIEDISLHYIPRRAHFSRNKRFPTLHPGPVRRRTQTLKLHQKLCVCVCVFGCACACLCVSVNPDMYWSSFTSHCSAPRTAPAPVSAGYHHHRGTWENNGKCGNPSHCCLACTEDIVQHCAILRKSFT